MFELNTYDPFFNFFFPTRIEGNSDLLKVDVIKNKEGYLLKADIPGVKKEDVKVSFDRGLLSINVKYHNEIKESEQYIYQERAEGEITRTFRLDEYIDSKDIDASIDDGVLTLTIKKSQPVKDKKSQDIEIR